MQRRLAAARSWERAGDGGGEGATGRFVQGVFNAPPGKGFNEARGMEDRHGANHGTFWCSVERMFPQSAGGGGGAHHRHGVLFHVCTAKSARVNTANSRSRRARAFR